MHIISKTVLLTALIIPLSAASVAGAEGTKITGRSFNDYHITSLSIGSDVTDISADAFSNMHELGRISVSEDNTVYSSYEGCLYDKDRTKLIYIPMGLSRIVIPETVTDISRNALEGLSERAKREVASVVEKNRTGSSEKKEKVSEEEKPSAEDEKEPEKPQPAVATINCPDTPLGNMTKFILEYLGVENMPQEKALRICYDHMIRTYTYRRFQDAYIPGWTGTYAADLFTTGSGNCSSYAAGLAYLAKGIGLESRVATGKIGSITGAPTTHAWTEVFIDGGWYIFDAEMDQAKPAKEYYKKTYSNYPSSGLKKDLEWSCEF